MEILKMKFGESGEKVDAHGIRFYGKIDGMAYHLGYMSEMMSSPDMEPMTKYKRITLWFTFRNIRSYKEVSTFLGRLTNELKAEGYMIMVSSLDELVDTTSPEYEGLPESKFPVSDRVHGYNAAGGFSVTAEKRDAEPGFSLQEIETIQKVAVKLGRTIYGRALQRMARRI